MSAATGGLALFVLPLSALSERFGRRTRDDRVAVVAAAALGLLVPFAPNLTWLVALRAVQGAALAGLPASAMAFLAEEVAPKALVAAIGLFVAGNSIGGMSGADRHRLGRPAVGLAGGAGRDRAAGASRARSPSVLLSPEGPQLPARAR